MFQIGEINETWDFHDEKCKPSQNSHVVIFFKHHGVETPAVFL